MFYLPFKDSSNHSPPQARDSELCLAVSDTGSLPSEDPMACWGRWVWGRVPPTAPWSVSVLEPGGLASHSYFWTALPLPVCLAMSCSCVSSPPELLQRLAGGGASRRKLASVSALKSVPLVGEGTRGHCIYVLSLLCTRSSLCIHSSIALRRLPESISSRGVDHSLCSWTRTVG